MSDVNSAQPSARIRLRKNSGVLLYEQAFAPDPETYDQHVGQAITIDPSGVVTLSIGNIAAVRNFLLQSDTPVTVRVNGQANGVDLVGSNMVMAVYSGSLTEIEVENNHSTNSAAVQYLVTD